jgi:hypothetical protein
VTRLRWARSSAPVPTCFLRQKSEKQSLRPLALLDKIMFHQPVLLVSSTLRDPKL